MTTQVQTKCYRDRTRQCGPDCEAYNHKPLEGTHCLKLHAMYAQADATRKQAKAIEDLSSSLKLVLQLSMSAQST